MNFLRVLKFKVIFSLKHISIYISQALGGYASAWSGPVIPKLRDLKQSPLPYLLTETQLSLVATLLYLGAIVGPYIVLWLSNVKGRKPCLILSGVLIGVGFIILAAARSISVLFLGRFLSGMGIGGVGVMNVVYIGEIASANIRGILLTLVGLCTTLGTLLLFATGSYVSYYVTCYIAVAISIVFVFCLFFIPESPMFYALHGKYEELEKVLQDLDRLDDMNELMETKKEVTNTKKDWIDLFTIRINRKALLIVIIINIFQQCSGVLAIVFFSAAIFEMAGSPIESSLAMIIIACSQLIGSTLTPMFIENTGRKKVLIMSSAACSFGMFLLGLYFYLDHIGNPVIDHIKWLPLVILILFYIAYDCGLNIIPLAIIGEMFTSNVRSKGSTVTMTTSWLFGFAVTTAFGALLEAVGGHVAFWFFSVSCACAMLFTIFFIPETKGKSLLEIQKAL